MKILSADSLAIPDVKIVRFARFTDHRGYFTEPFRRSDVDREIPFLSGVQLPQMNESWSRAGALRGLHFQWNPVMGKLVRTVHGAMVDLFLDVRLGSPTFGRIGMHAMSAPTDGSSGEWIWIPPGFAHGNFFPAASHIEYLCSGEYSPGCEAAISPLSPDFDWSLCDPALKSAFDALVASGPIITDKDRQGLSLSEWRADPRAQNFIHGQC